MASARVRRVVVGVSGSLANLAALHAAAEQARRYDVPLVAVSAWQPIGGEPVHRHAPCPRILQMWRNQAANRVRTAVLDAFGAPPRDLDLTLLTARGHAGPVLVALAARPGDMLVVGTGRSPRAGKPHRGKVSRYCLGHARCPVLAVPPPDLLSEARHGRFRVHDRDLASAGLLSSATKKGR